jgi:hypothetical protein
MPALTIDGTPVWVIRWTLIPEYPGGEETTTGIDRSTLSGVTAARAHHWDAEVELAAIERDDAIALEAALTDGARVTIGGDLPTEERVATVHDLQRIEDPDDQRVLLYGALRMRLMLDPVEEAEE